MQFIEDPDVDLGIRKARAWFHAQQGFCVVNRVLASYSIHAYLTMQLCLGTYFIYFQIRDILAHC